MDIQALRAEIESDPAALGYAPLVAAGNEGGIADKLNAVNPAILVSRGQVSRDTFMMSLQRGLADILGRADTDPVKQAFRGWLALMSLASNINTDDAGVIATLGQAVTAGVFTQSEVDGALKRAGSRAEQLFGSGTVVSWDDVGAALKGS